MAFEILSGPKRHAAAFTYSLDQDHIVWVFERDMARRASGRQRFEQDIVEEALLLG